MVYHIMTYIFKQELSFSMISLLSMTFLLLLAYNDMMVQFDGII